MELLNTLYVTTPGALLRLDNETVRVEREGETLLRVPLHHLQAIVCFGHVSLSTPLMHEAAQRGVGVVLLDSNGRFQARLEGPVSGNVLLRQAQHTLANDAPRAIEIARCVVAGKLRNQRNVLMRGARDAREASDAAALAVKARSLAASVRATARAETLDALRGVEGEGARTYFEGLNRIVRSDRREVFSLDGRTRRPPRDAMNALLSFIYALWMNDCRSACEAAGLDPQVGYLHALRPGRAALALDLMEEFRPLGDRLALTLVNRGQLDATDVVTHEGGAFSLTEQARKTVITAYQQRKQDEVPHRLCAAATPLGVVPLVQARLLARCIRGDAPVYIPFSMS